MRLFPDDPLPILRNGLKSRRPYIVLEALIDFPKYALDSEIQQGVINQLSNSVPRDRRNAAYVLYKIGHPLGVEHLVYCALTVHPKLGYVQKHWDTQIYSRMALCRVADVLQDRHIQLLLEDTRNPDGNLHMDALAAAQKERIVDRIRPWLKGTERERIQAAYVLAMKSEREGAPVLKELLRSGRHIECAFVGLSHIPDSESISLFRDYLDPGHHLYHSPRAGYADWLFPAVQRILDLRLPWSENPSDKTFIDYILRYCISSGP